MDSKAKDGMAIIIIMSTLQNAGLSILWNRFGSNIPHSGPLRLAVDFGLAG